MNFSLPACLAVLATSPFVGINGSNREMLKAALEDLPMEFRDANVLREMEGFSYQETADISAGPIGTVMSGLARARKRLQISLAGAAARNYSSPATRHEKSAEGIRSERVCLRSKT